MTSDISLMTTSLTSATARKLLVDLDAELTNLYPDHPYPPPFGDEEARGIGAVLIAYHDRRAAGCGAVRMLDRDAGLAEVLRMYVLPSARRRGIGRTLLHGLEAEAIDMGARRVVLETGDRQPDALALYEQHGYEPIDPWLDAPNPHSIFMGRDLPIT